MPILVALALCLLAWAVLSPAENNAIVHYFPGGRNATEEVQKYAKDHGLVFLGYLELHERDFSPFTAAVDRSDVDGKLAVFSKKK